MKKLILFLLTAMLLTVCGQANQNSQEAVYMNITAQEAMEIMDTQEGYVCSPEASSFKATFTNEDQ